MSAVYLTMVSVTKDYMMNDRMVVNNKLHGIRNVEVMSPIECFSARIKFLLYSTKKTPPFK